MAADSPPILSREWHGSVSIVRDVSPELLALAGEDTTKAADANAGYPTFVFLASDAIPDSYEDIVLQEWDLVRYKINPVILWGHNSWEMPIGRGRAFMDGGKLYIAVTVWDSPKCALGQQAAEGIRDGMINAGSVGFRSRKVTARSLLPKTDPNYAERGYLLGDNQLYEFSLCSIPAMPNAVVQRTAGGPLVTRDGGEDETGDPHLDHALCLADSLADLLADAAAYAVRSDADPALLALSRSVVALVEGPLAEVQAWISNRAAGPPVDPPMDVTASASPPTASVVLNVRDWLGPAVERLAGEAAGRSASDEVLAFLRRGLPPTA